MLPSFHLWVFLFKVIKYSVYIVLLDFYLYNQQVIYLLVSRVASYDCNHIANRLYFPLLHFYS